MDFERNVRSSLQLAPTNQPHCSATPLGQNPPSPNAFGVETLDEMSKCKNRKIKNGVCIYLGAKSAGWRRAYTLLGCLLLPTDLLGLSTHLQAAERAEWRASAASGCGLFSAARGLAPTDSAHSHYKSNRPTVCTDRIWTNPPLHN
jgi:hypothetical protein